MKQTYVAELIGTFILVALGSMAVLGSGGNLVIIAFGFGIALEAEEPHLLRRHFGSGEQEHRGHQFAFK